MMANDNSLAIFFVVKNVRIFVLIKDTMFFKDFSTGVSSYGKALSLISKLNLWKYFFVSIRTVAGKNR